MPRADEPGDRGAGDAHGHPRRPAADRHPNAAPDPAAVPDPTAPNPLAPDPAVPAPSAPRGSNTPGWDETADAGSDGSRDDASGRRDAGRTRRAAREETGQRDDVGAEPERQPVPLTQQIGRIAIVVLAILFGVFAVVNSQAVDFSWVFGETHVRPAPAGEGEVGGVPLIVLLVAAFVVGALLGALLQWNAARGRRLRGAPRRR